MPFARLRAAGEKKGDNDTEDDFRLHNRTRVLSNNHPKRQKSQAAIFRAHIR
jgi:hypothetical protein